MPETSGIPFGGQRYWPVDSETLEKRPRENEVHMANRKDREGLQHGGKPNAGPGANALRQKRLLQQIVPAAD
jgi:hypothetical protein